MRHDVQEDRQVQIKQYDSVDYRTGECFHEADGSAFHLRFSIQEDAYKIQAYVVPTHFMTAELILGRDFLKDIEIIIKKGRFEVKWSLT